MTKKHVRAHCWTLELSPRSQIFIIININFIHITQQPKQDRLAENQPMAGLSNLNEYENWMKKSETELRYMFRFGSEQRKPPQ